MPVRVLRFLTSSSLYLALNGSLVVVFGYFLYRIEMSFFILLAAFLATYSVYGLNKATDKAEDVVNRPDVASKNPKYFVISSVVAMMFSLGIGAMEGPWVVAVLLTPLVVGMVYSVRISKRVPRIKEVLGAKSLSVAFSWAFTGSFLPAVMHPVLFEESVLVFSYIFVSLLVNTVLFDVLDLRGDSVSGIKTIPFALGLSKTKKLLLGVHSCLVVWVVYCLLRGLFLNFMPALVFGVFYGYFFILYFLSNRRMRLRAELMVDGSWVPLIATMVLFLK